LDTEDKGSKLPHDVCKNHLVGRHIPEDLNIHKRQISRREENQLDATEWFIALALIICSTCFGHLYETKLVLLPHMVCNTLVASGRRSGAGPQAIRP